MARLAAAPAGSPEVYEVVEGFVTELNGALVVYTKGEPVHPDDPFLRAMPDRFGPLVFPHPIRRAGRLTAPEVRS